MSRRGQVLATAASVAVGLAPRWGAEGAAWASMAREPVSVALGALLLIGGRAQAATERIRVAIGVEGQM